MDPKLKIGSSSGPYDVLAEIGIVRWADVTHPHTGRWLSWGEARQRFGERLNGVADRRDYLRAEASTAYGVDAGRW